MNEPNEIFDFTHMGYLFDTYYSKEKEIELRVKLLEYELDRYQTAIKGITKWLSASINDNCCKQYVEACNRCFDVDTQFDKMRDLKNYEYRE